MTGRRAALVAALALGLLAAWFIFRPGEDALPPPSTADAPALAVSPASAAPASLPDSTPKSVPAGPRPQAAAVVATPPPAMAGGNVAIIPSVPDRGAAPARPSPQTEVERVHRMITDYHTLMGENPVGTNAEIMRALMGANPHQATLGPPEGQTLNDKGELIDPWGTPYFFHQMSRDEMEIHSAGPDKIMGTPDDVVTK